jgi:O-acetylserine/cysteine efflux transporter
MEYRHILLALLVAAIWGLNFTVISIGLGSFPPLLLAAMRFAMAAIPALVLPRPALPWGRLIAISTFLFLGQFALLFSSMALGMPAGLASVTLQSQAFLTILIAVVALRERPTRRQILGTVVALAGLAGIAGTVGGDLSALGLTLCLGAALCWAVGNVLLKGAGRADMFALVAWLSLFPPLPLLGLSLLIDGPATVGQAISSMGWRGAGAVLYIAVLSTTVSFAIWGRLIRRYPASVVAPFSLLVPVSGALSASLVLGEQFSGTRVAGMALILLGLVVLVAPSGRHVLMRRA